MVQNTILLKKLVGTPIPLTRHYRIPMYRRLANEKVKILLKADGNGIPKKEKKEGENSEQNNSEFNLFSSTRTPFSNDVSNTVLESHPDRRAPTEEEYSKEELDKCLLAIYFVLICTIGEVKTLFLLKKDQELSLSEKKAKITENTKELSLIDNQLFKDYIESTKHKCIYIDFNACCNRLLDHNFSMKRRSKHFFELVKLYKIPNLYHPKFCTIKTSEKGHEFYEPFPSTQEIFKILSICQATLALQLLFKDDSKFSDVRKTKRIHEAMKFFLYKLKQHFDIAQSTDLTELVEAHTFCVTQSIEAALHPDQSDVPKTVTSVFCIIPPIGTFLNEAPVLQIVTSYFEDSDESILPNKQFPKADNPKGEEETIQKIYDFAQYIGTYFPVVGENGIIRKLVTLRSPNTILSTEINSIEEEKKLLAQLAQFNNINPLHCNIEEFKKCIYKNS